MHGNLQLQPPAGPDAARPQPPSEGADPEANEIAQLLQLVWRQRVLILLVTLLGTLAVAAVAWRLPASYRAEAVLLFAAAEQVDPVRTRQPAEQPGDLRHLASEIELIRSRSLLSLVVDDAGLLYEPGFNPVLGRTPGPLERLGLRAPPPPDTLRLSRQRAATLATLRRRLQVRPVGQSRALSVVVEAPTAAGAARVANAVTQVYLTRAEERARADRAAATAWLDRRVGELRQRVQVADAAVADFRIESGLADRGPDSPAVRDRVSGLNQALAQARAATATAQARLQQVSAWVPDSGGGVQAVPTAASPAGAAPPPSPAAASGAGAAGPLDRSAGAGLAGAMSSAPPGAFGDSLSSRALSGLRQQEAGLARQHAQLAVRYGPRHPRLRAADAELRELRLRIDTARARALDRLDRDAQLAREREAALREELRQLNVATGELSRAQVRLAQLEREAAAERALFDSFLARLKETRVTAGSPGSPAELITRAQPPGQPSAPNRPLLAGFGVLAAVAVAFGLALLRDLLDRGVRSPQQLERLTGLRVLAAVPQVRRAPAARVLMQPAGALADALRGLYTALLLSDPDRPPRTVLVTSALPGEGKTALACTLARVLARSGRRVLLIDADLRYPRVADNLDVAPEPGLDDLLTRQTTLPVALQTDPRPELGGRLTVLPAGRAGDPGRLLDSESLGTLIADLRPHYDLILVDAPPVLAVADPRTLAARVDTTVVAVRWAGTPRQSVERAVTLLRDAGAALAGAALVQVDARHHAREASGTGFGRRRPYYAGT